MSEILNMAPASLFLFSQSEKLFLTTNLSLCLLDSQSFGKKTALKYEILTVQKKEFLRVAKKYVNYRESKC